MSDKKKFVISKGEQYTFDGNDLRAFISAGDKLWVGPAQNSSSHYCVYYVNGISIKNIINGDFFLIAKYDVDER